MTPWFSPTFHDEACVEVMPPISAPSSARYLERSRELAGGRKQHHRFRQRRL